MLSRLQLYAKVNR